MPRRFEPAGPIGQDLDDESKLTEYHADPAGYVQAQQDAGVLSAESARLILAKDPVITATLNPRGGTSIARVVFPP